MIMRGVISTPNEVLYRRNEMKKMITVFAAITLFAFGLSAAPAPKAVLENSGATLRLVYDERNYGIENEDWFPIEFGTLDLGNGGKSAILYGSMRELDAYLYLYDIETIIVDSSFAAYYPTQARGWFSGFPSLTQIEGLRNFNTAKITDMSEMFFDCPLLEQLDLSSFNTSKVEDMSFMFEGCSSLASLDLNSFNTSNVESMESMFEGCSSLSSLDLSSFNTTEVTKMNCMFKGCKSLPSLDLSSFNTLNVKDMDDMFRGCSSLSSVNLSSFNTSKVYYMRDMFNGCSSLQALYLTTFTFNEGVRVSGMFAGVGRADSITKIHGSTQGGYEFLLANKNSLGSGYYEILPQRFF